LNVEALETGLRLLKSGSQLIIQFPSSSNEHVSIYSISGQVIYRSSVNFNNEQAVISPNLKENQVYVLRIQNETIKFILN
jgi:hypothetical protein